MSKVLVIGRNTKLSAISNHGDIELTYSGRVADSFEAQKLFNYTKPKQENQWRGGSRGKGGKTKWPRR